MINTAHFDAFARLDEYAGLWACMAEPLQRLREQIRQFDLLKLLALPKPGEAPAKAAVEKMAISGGKAIARIQLTGLLMRGQSWWGGTSTLQAIKDIRSAAADSDVSGILLSIDSPGGSVAGTANLGDEIKAATRSKPVVAHIDTLGASAAYWAASQATRIVAEDRTALVGSIGTIWPLADTSAGEAAAGIVDVSKKTGPLKGIGYGPITPEQQAHIQELVDKIQMNFDAAVKKGRGMNDKQLAAVRHGGVFTAEDALANGMIDAIQPLAKTIAELSKTPDSSRGRNVSEERTDRACALFPMLRRELPMLTSLRS